MNCKKCNKKQSLFSKYCEDCGTKLERRKITKEDKKKIRTVVILLIVIVSVLFISCKTFCYLNSPEYKALSYFEAIINNDIEKIYTYLNVDESEFINKEFLSEKIDEINGVKNYHITKVSEYKDYVIVSISYTTNQEIKATNVKLVRKNTLIDPYEVVSGKLVEDVEFKIPSGATITIDGIDLSSYREEENQYDIYKISAMIKGTYQVKVTINDVIIEENIDIEQNNTYTISNVDLPDSLKDTIITKTKEELNYWYSSILSDKNFDELKEHYVVSSKNELRSSYNSFKRNINSDITAIEITDLEVKKSTYSKNGNLYITYLVDQKIQKTDSYIYTNYISVEYEYINGNYEIYNINRK